MISEEEWYFRTVSEEVAEKLRPMQEELESHTPYKKYTSNTGRNLFQVGEELKRGMNDVVMIGDRYGVEYDNEYHVLSSDRPIVYSALKTQQKNAMTRIIDNYNSELTVNKITVCMSDPERLYKQLAFQLQHNFSVESIVYRNLYTGIMVKQDTGLVKVESRRSFRISMNFTKFSIILTIALNLLIPVISHSEFVENLIEAADNPIQIDIKTRRPS